MMQTTSQNEAVYNFTHIHNVTLHNGADAALGISFHGDSLLFLYTSNFQDCASSFLKSFAPQNNTDFGVQIASRSLTFGEGYVVPVFFSEDYQSKLSLTHPDVYGTVFSFPLSQHISEPQFTFLQSQIEFYLNGLLGFMADSASRLSASDMYLSVRFERDHLLLPEDLLPPKDSSDDSHSHPNEHTPTPDTYFQSHSVNVLSLDRFHLIKSHGRYNSLFSLDYRIARDGGLALLTFFKNARVHPSWETHVHYKIPKRGNPHENGGKKDSNIGNNEELVCVLRACLNL